MVRSRLKCPGSALLVIKKCSFTMCKLRFFSVLILFSSNVAFGLFSQTEDDLRTLEDYLVSQFDERADLKASLTPMLLAPPRHLWEESRSDFGPSSVAVLKRIFSEPQNLILCEECGHQRLHVGKDHTISLSTGEVSQIDLLALTSDPRYQDVKSVAFVRETPSGVEIRIVKVRDAAIALHFLADSRIGLEQAKQRMGLVTELERRKRGESLAYTFIDLGLYPNPLFHVSFLEQWGTRNQHLTGIVLSFLNPEFAIGATYRYMLPSLPRCTIAGTLFYPLQNAVVSSDEGGLSGFAFSVGAQYAFSSTFGVFVEGGTSGSISAGLSFFNPIWFPFML